MAGTHELSECLCLLNAVSEMVYYSQHADFMNARNGHMYRPAILAQMSVYGPLPYNAFQHMWPGLNALCLYGDGIKWHFL